MPILQITQGEQQTLKRILSRELCLLNDDQAVERQYLSEIKTFRGLSSDEKKALRKQTYNRMKRNREKMHTRVALLKKIKSATNTIEFLTVKGCSL